MRTKRTEIVVDREKLLEYLASKPISKAEARAINKIDKPPKEMTDKQKAHVANLVAKNRERFQKMAEEKLKKKEEIQETKEQIVEEKNAQLPPSKKETIKISVRNGGKPDPVLPDPFEESDDESDEEIIEESESEPEPAPKKKKVAIPVVLKRQKKKVVESDTDTSDSDADIKPKKIQKMVKTLNKIDETLQKANVPVNPYLNMLNRRFIRK